MNGEAAGLFGFIMGLMVAFVAVVIFVNCTKVNISDDELYRFCIVNKVELKDCVIPPFHVQKEKEK